MVVSLGAGKRITLDNLVEAAVSRPNTIEVEEGSLAKVQEFYEKSVTHNDGNSTSWKNDVNATLGGDVKKYPVEVIRAGIVARIFSLLATRTPVRAVTLRVLTELVNKQLTPVLSNTKNAGLELSLFLCGVGAATAADGSTVAASEALAAAGFAEYTGATRTETQAFNDNSFLAVGLAGLVASGANHLLKGIDAIAALSCEAIGSKGADVFDPVLYETHRQHRGQMLSAGNLKLLLEGSKRVNAAAHDLAGSKLSLFHNIPQSMGPAQESITVLNK